MLLNLGIFLLPSKTIQLCCWLKKENDKVEGGSTPCTRGASSYPVIQELHTGGKIRLQLLLKIDEIDDRWQFEKGKLKAELCILVDNSYQTEFFNILAIGQKYLSIYQPSFFNIAT